ncbi:MAG: Crp/Fnr family transcriptional regulator [Erythrobacter sp.]
MGKIEIGEKAEALLALLQCSASSADALAAAMQLCSFPNKDILVYQGDWNNRFWLILGGTVQLQVFSAEGRATVISAFGTGELIGAFPQEEESNFEITALGDVATLQIGGHELRDLIEECPDLGVGLSTIYAGQLQSVLDRLSARVSLSAAGRICRELLRLTKESGTIDAAPSITALALKAQTTRETGSRTISLLERRGLIEREGAKLSIISRRLLEDLVV